MNVNINNPPTLWTMLHSSEQLDLFEPVSNVPEIGYDQENQRCRLLLPRINLPSINRWEAKWLVDGDLTSLPTKEREDDDAYNKHIFTWASDHISIPLAEAYIRLIKETIKNISKHYYRDFPDSFTPSIISNPMPILNNLIFGLCQSFDHSDVQQFNLYTCLLGYSIWLRILQGDIYHAWVFSNMRDAEDKLEHPNYFKSLNSGNKIPSVLSSPIIPQPSMPIENLKLLKELKKIVMEHRQTLYDTDLPFKELFDEVSQHSKQAMRFFKKEPCA